MEEEVLETKDMSNEDLMQKLQDLEKECESYKEKALKLENTLKAINEKYVYLLKEHEQLKEHFKKENQYLRKYGHENLAKDIIDIIDNFERALAQFNNNPSLEEPTIKNILIGIEMIYKDFKNILKKHGIEELELKGQIFDPTIAEAIDTVQDDSLQFNEIVDVSLKGYKLHDKVIRAAKVVVNVANEEIT